MSAFIFFQMASLKNTDSTNWKMDYFKSTVQYMKHFIYHFTLLLLSLCKALCCILRATMENLAHWNKPMKSDNQIIIQCKAANKNWEDI